MISIDELLGFQRINSGDQDFCLSDGLDFFEINHLTLSLDLEAGIV